MRVVVVGNGMVGFKLCQLLREPDRPHLPITVFGEEPVPAYDRVHLTDYLGRPFAPIPDLLAHAESITKTLAICVRCGNPAKHTQRLRGSDDLIVVGASEMYEARCRRCFEPGIPKQTELDFIRAKRVEKAPA